MALGKPGAFLGAAIEDNNGGRQCGNNFLLKKQDKIYPGFPVGFYAMPAQNFLKLSGGL
jgi:hypothetical protein